jgi:NADH:ubiquinone oxidoreductase subunit C
MPEGFDHHPLRKDFPHIGIEPDRLYRLWDEKRRAEYAADEKTRGN